MVIATLAKVAARRHRQPAMNLHMLVKCSRPLLELPYMQQHSQKPRGFSSRRGDPDFLCSNKAKNMISNLDVGTNDFMRYEGPFISTELNSFFLEAEAAAVQTYDTEALKDLYYRLVRPELVSRLLVHSYDLDHASTDWLHYQTHGRTKRTPRFTTSYDLMYELVGLPDQNWVLYLNYLSKERIAVIEQWGISISTTERLMYNYGFKDFSGIHFYKGESDASYNESEGTADLSTLIWDDQQVISAKTHLGVADCKSPAHSEGKAALAVMREAKELGIEHFVLWTDSIKIREVMSGKSHVPCKDRNWGLYMALRSMRSSFKHLEVLCVPREMVDFADGMLREPSVQYAKTAEVMYPRYFKQPAKRWAYLLNGLPIFRLSMTSQAVRTMSNFVKPLNGELSLSNRKFYVELSRFKKV